MKMKSIKKNDVRNSLDILGKTLIEKNIVENFDLDDDSAYWEVATEWLHRLLCPRRVQLESALRSEEANALVVVLDAIISASLSAPIPAMTIAKAISAYSLEKFCSDPRGLAEMDSKK